LLERCDLPRPLAAYYFSLGRRFVYPKTAIRPFFCDGRLSQENVDFMRQFIHLVETFWAGDHGSVLSYQRSSGDGVEPVLSSEPSHILASDMVEVQQNALVTFAHACADVLRGAKLEDYDWLRRAASVSMKHFYARPGKASAEVYGRVFFSALHDYEVGHTMACSYSWLDVIRYFRHGQYGHPFNSSAHWREGSMALSSGPVRKAMRAVWALPRRDD
jgi:hypothetical protein